MSYLIDHVAARHDSTIVLMALVICIVAALSIFTQLQRAFECVIGRRRFWLASAAITAGAGVWSTHFISMIAYRSADRLQFDQSLTALSALIAAGAFALAFALLRRSGGIVVASLCGAIATGGIVGMHLTGMAAIRHPAVVATDIRPVAVAASLGWLALSAAFALFVRGRGSRRIYLPAAGMVLTTIFLHFVAMSAAVIDHGHGTARGGNDTAWLLYWVVGASFLLVAGTAAASVLDRFLTDLRGLADATSEGLLITGDDRILEANERACALLGVSRGEVIWTSVACWFETADAAGLSPGESLRTRITGSTIEDQLVELTARTIEYRGRAATVIALRDLTETGRAERAIAHLASHDTLTGLANRAACDGALAAAVRSGVPFGMMAIDLDRFRAVNDLFGHGAGDAILIRVARILEQAIGAQDMVARIGGDEFVVLQRQIGSLDDTRRLAAHVAASLAAEMDSARDPTAIGCSLGVVTFPRDGTDPETLRHNASVALTRAKEDGRGRASFFDAVMDRDARERQSLEHDLRHAICRDQLRLVYQPLVATATGDVVGYEALLRWTHPARGAVSPALFIPVAEEAGTIGAIGEWVLRQACREAALWPSQLSLAVNVSPVQLRLPSLPELVRAVLDDNGFDPARLELEITETALLRDRETSLAILREIRALGVRIAMDDFGTGYSSLSNLRHFPFDKIKIDRSFVSAMHEDEAALSIVRAVAGLGKGLKLPVVAEGVETEQQRRMVQAEGCLLAQGYLFGRPGAVLPARRIAKQRA
ncbi:EAL domain-containing protein [Sphingomonas sp. 2R-10]|uniref:putative bifunctional diguanylate cyclase/phosphodiesterase n=1 Tax=Sphingomonas sp. 2R-10 TaxID=3045148 RepID=UPI000F7A34FA|nr:EAL domain-containing protein [Sphingomonas sp. 2R-10]MDJ0275339.1 EAL domain-containing protein [Sphingomonas sp. 2R-10]